MLLENGGRGLRQNTDVIHMNDTLPAQGNSHDRFSSFSDILDNDTIDLNNISSSDLFTSTIQPTRLSERQARKRARLFARSQVSPVREESSPPPPTPATITSRPGPSTPAFVPRRKPVGGIRGCGNFRYHPDVNAGKGTSGDDLLQMHIPKDLIAQFRRVSQSNTEKGIELGGVLA